MLRKGFEHAQKSLTDFWHDAHCVRSNPDRGTYDINIYLTRKKHETKFTSMEEERTDAMEMAAKAHEERKAQTTEEIIGNLLT